MATPESLFDYDGPWSPDMINLMTPMAEEAELAEKERIVESVGTVFGKDAIQGFLDRAAKLTKGIRKRALQARGVEIPEALEDKAAEAAQALKDGFAGLGARNVPKGRSRR
jgi:hypothetical protein